MMMRGGKKAKAKYLFNHIYVLFRAKDVRKFINTDKYYMSEILFC